MDKEKDINNQNKDYHDSHDHREHENHDHHNKENHTCHNHGEYDHNHNKHKGHCEYINHTHDDHEHHNHDEQKGHCEHCDHHKENHEGHTHDHQGHGHHSHNGHEHHNHDDYSRHAGHHHHGNFKKLFLTSLPIGLVIMWISPLMGINIPFPFQYTFQYSDIVALVLSFVLIIYGGKPFFSGAVDELKHKSPGMMSLVSLGVGVSFIYSVHAVIMRYATGVHYMDFFFEFASLVLIMLLGHWIEMVALGQAGDAKESLAKLLPKQANLVLDINEIKEVPISDLKVGDIIQVLAGENVAADGVVIKGESRINEALLTGESKPVAKGVNDTVIGGSTNENGLLQVRVTKTGSESFLSQVQLLMEEAQNQPSRAEDKAKKVASYLFYIALIAAVISFVIWWVVADLDSAIRFAVTTLVIACPHALGLAIPLVISRSTSIGAKKGLLVKNREAYNLTTKATTMILDKTGTITTGEFKVLRMDVLDNTYIEEEIISLFYGIESGSSHPIAQSIIKYSKDKNVSAVHFDSVEILAGKGLKATLKKDIYEVLSQKAYNKEIDIKDSYGSTVSILTKNGNAIGVVLLGDEIKDTSYHLIEALKKKKITPIMATGDNESAAKAVADKLGLLYYANQSPEDKYNLVKSLKDKGEVVIMVGDGINDAPSLMVADVGVAIGAGTQVAIDSADVILTNSEPGDIEAFIDLSFKTNRKMNQNLVWGAGYNFIAIPLAAGILATVGFIISPAIGAVMMSLSTIIVAFNAMTLR
ncbi:MAG: copper-translocating P-type ATPase [Acholeplasmataceae bacterium]|nr:copper-translocating P-type ATPase [Acholeplasmataceae bacterium]